MIAPIAPIAPIISLYRSYPIAPTLSLLTLLQVLKDPVKRAEYDKRRKGAPSPARGRATAARPAASPASSSASASASSSSGKQRYSRQQEYGQQEEPVESLGDLVAEMLRGGGLRGLFNDFLTFAEGGANADGDGGASFDGDEKSVVVASEALLSLKVLPTAPYCSLLSLADLT